MRDTLHIKDVTDGLKSKLAAAPRMTDDEYRAAVKAAYARAYQASIKPVDPMDAYGLHQDEIDNLDWNRVIPGLSDGPKAVEIIKPFVARWHGMVYLGGSSGQAKTLILKIVTAIAARQHRQAHYIDMRDVMQDLRASYEKDYQRDELSIRMQRWIDIPILCIDEIDKTNSTEWVKEQMFYLLDKRYSRAVREEALTVLAGNVTTEGISPYLQSRLQDGRGAYVNLSGPDGRKFMSQGNWY